MTEKKGILRHFVPQNDKEKDAQNDKYGGYDRKGQNDRKVGYDK